MVAVNAAFLIASLLTMSNVNAFVKPHSGMNREAFNRAHVLSKSMKDGPAPILNMDIKQFKDAMEKRSKTLPFDVEISPAEEMRVLKATGISRGDNFWETTFQKRRKERVLAIQSGDIEKRKELEKNYHKLMAIGFKRRLESESVELNYFEGEGEGEDVELPIGTLLKRVALETSARFELKKSKEEQLKEITLKKQSERSGLVKFLPSFLHKYVDYVSSLRKDPSPAELTRNLLISSVLSLISVTNAKVRMAVIYTVVGYFANLSILLTRNMPEKRQMQYGMQANMASWSTASFQTAFALTFLFSSISFLLTRSLLALVPPLVGSIKMRISLAVSLLLTSALTSFFEVFEEKGKGGWRWKKAMESYLPSSLQQKLKEQVFGQGKDLDDTYAFNYNPMRDEFPPRPHGKPTKEEELKAAAERIDEVEAAEHYDKWLESRKDARRRPIEKVEEDHPLVRTKQKGIFANSTPSWVQKAYKKKVVSKSKWKSSKRVFAKDYSEFDPIEGPFGFRDRTPQWLLEMFFAGMWEEGATAGKKAARKFGAYRKTNYKKDKEVVLQPWDGADKQKEKK